MTDFHLDKKREHEAAAESALRKKDYEAAWRHIAEAATFGFKLADRTDGKVREAYAANAKGLVALAERIKKEKGGMVKVAGEEGAVAASCQVARPTVRLADVAGMEAVKDQIRLRVIEPLRHADEAKRHGLKVGGGILLYGPPGTGKTFLAKAVAGELDLPFYALTAADVFGKYVGESENNIRNLFREARKNPLSVVFIDELETIFRKRTDQVHETTQKVVSVILQELDGVDDRRNPILLLGATNTPWLVDEAFMRTGRFDVLAYVGLPDAAARRQILLTSLKDVDYPLAPEAVEAVVAHTDRFSGADLKGLAQKVKQRAFDLKAAVYDVALFEEALKDAVPSCKGETLERIEAWEKANDIRRGI